MKIIMLLGPSGCGKTKTLNLVYDALHPKGDKEIVKKIILGNSKQKDFECIIKYKRQKIAFFTMGHCALSLVDAIARYATQKNIKLLVCSLNTEFIHKDKLKHLEQFEDIIFVKKIKEDSKLNKDIQDNNKAHQIIGQIDKLW